MNELAYFLVNSHGMAGPVPWIINIIVYLILAVILWMILKWAAAEFGVPPQIVKLIGLLLFLLMVLSLFVGCAGLPPRTYSLQYTDEKGRSIGGGVTLGDTRGLKK